MSSFAGAIQRPTYTALPITTASYGCTDTTLSGATTTASSPASRRPPAIKSAISAVPPCFEAADTRTRIGRFLRGCRPCGRRKSRVGAGRPHRHPPCADGPSAAEGRAGPNGLIHGRNWAGADVRPPPMSHGGPPVRERPFGPGVSHLAALPVAPVPLDDSGDETAVAATA